MKIGIIGAGAIGLAFAVRATAGGHHVIISNSRGPATLGAVIKDLKGVQAGTRQEAVAADVVMIAVPWQHLDAAIAGLDLNGKIVLDPNNPIINPGFILPDLGGKTSSEIVASKIPGASLVKIFNTLPPALIAASPLSNGGNRVVFFSGDNKSAKDTVRKLVEGMGFAGIDLGGLADGGRMQQFPGGPLAALHLVKHTL